MFDATLPGAATRVLADTGAVATAAAATIRAQAAAAIAARGVFRLCLAGGTTPVAAYHLLAAAPEDPAAPWCGWHIYHGDERCLPPGDPERNSRAADLAWLNHVPIPAPQVHPIPAELGPEAAASAYARLLADALPFDLVLLGIGEDGHTASLFPTRPWAAEAADEELVMPVHDAPKPPPERVSLTPRALTATRAMLVLVTGAGKREAVGQWRAGVPLPIARVLGGLAAPAEVLMDREAAR